MSASGPIAGTPWKMTFFIRHPNKLISESHWLSAVGASETQALAAATALCPLRANLMPTDCQLEACRLSKENVFRDSLYVPGLPILVSPTYGASYGTSDLGDESWKVRLEASSLHRKSLYLAPLPDAMVINESMFFANSPWIAQYYRYLNALLSVWGFVSIVSSDNVLVNPVKKITALLEVAGANSVQLTSVGHGYVQGDAVRVSGFKGINCSQLNGSFYVGLTGADTFYISMSPYVLRQNIVVRKWGTVSSMKRDVYPYNNYVSPDVTSGRKRGNRGFEPLGRSRNRKGGDS